VAALLERAHLGRCDAEVVELLFPPDSFEVSQLEARIEVVEAATRQRLGPRVRVVVREGEGGAPSMAERHDTQQAERKRRLVEDNPRVVDAVTTFEGDVVAVELAKKTEEEALDG